MRVIGLFVVTAAMVCPSALVAAEPPVGENFSRDKLVAWCIVPFDAKRRGPEERAQMIERLGMKRVAYDWRDEHVPTFEQEIQQYQQHGLEFFAFWSWHDDFAPLVKKYGIKPQIWMTCPSPAGGSQTERVTAAVQELLPLARKTAELDLPLGLYNHGGWGGEPRNLIAVCEVLRRELGAGRVGIVYNFHHGHDHMADFRESFALMKPHLLCLNLNGMADASRVSGGQDKILPIGTGQHERDLLRIVIDSRYDGPIGILDHRPELDAEQSLRENLTGLEQVLQELAPGPDE
ncbi:MAG: hypothetical protein AB7U20_07480 [Planctomycetaceae bacterium]